MAGRSCLSPGRCLSASTDAHRPVRFPPARGPHRAAAREPRDSARLLLVRPGEAPFEDRIVRDLPDLLRAGDVLVLNDTRVIPAASKACACAATASPVEVDPDQAARRYRWRALARPASGSRRATASASAHDGRVCLLGALDATVAAKGEGGEVTLAFDLAGRRSRRAIAARRRHAAAALHRRQARRRGRRPRATTRPSTPSRTARSRRRRRACTSRPSCWRRSTRAASTPFVTLHVGAGTFLPVKADDTADHRMHAEWGEVSADDRDGAQRGARRAAAASSPSAPRRCACWRAPPARRRRSAPSGARPRSSSRPATGSAPSTC